MSYQTQCSNGHWQTDDAPCRCEKEPIMTNNEPWIQTYTGEKFYLLKPQVGRIHIRDLAHSLSMVPRFGGHTERPLSIAAHSMVVQDLLSQIGRNEEGWGLVHDCQEAYIHDISSPLKSTSLFDEYRALEKVYQTAMGIRFGLSAVMPLIVKTADMIALVAEAELTQAVWPLDNWTYHIKQQVVDSPFTVEDAKWTIAQYRDTPQPAIEAMFRDRLRALEIMNGL